MVPLTGSSRASEIIRDLLIRGHLHFEKCELGASREIYEQAVALARESGDSEALIESLVRLLRLASEAQDRDRLLALETEIHSLMVANPLKVPTMAWYGKAAVAGHQKQLKLARRYLLRYLRALRAGRERPEHLALMSHDEGMARGWAMLGNIAFQLGFVDRARFLVEATLARFEERKFRTINGILYLQMGWIHLKIGERAKALEWFQKAHGSFLEEHHWYYHLYVLFAYASLARTEKSYRQACWNLDLIEKAARGPEFALLREMVQEERGRLQEDAVDLLIDAKKGSIRTRESRAISLRKQYVLLHILEELSRAHARGSEKDRGLSKAELIEKVWREKYRPEAHDNKLYYNINRLRKILEPDLRQPRYLQNWKEGYRLAPSLKVRFISPWEIEGEMLNEK